MTKAALRLEELKSGTGRYARPKRAYGQPAEQVAAIKRQSDALQTMRRSRDLWRARAEAAERAVSAARLSVEALTELAMRASDRGILFSASKLRSALDGQ